MADEIKLRHCPATRIGNARECHQNDGSRSRVVGKAALQFDELRVIWINHFACPMQPHDLWRPREGAKHDDDAPVFLHMRGGLNAAAGEIDVSDLALAHYA